MQFQRLIETSAVRPYVKNRVSRLLEAQESISDLSQVHHVLREDVITEVDWSSREEDREVEFDYVYDVVMKKARKEDGKTYQMAYAITFDRELTPQECSSTGIQYGTMTLAGHPILYYVLFDLANLIGEARKRQ